MIYYGLEWHSLDTYFQIKEISAPATPPTNEVRLYAKDNGGVSGLYYKNDAGTEVGPLGGGTVTGSGSSNRMTYWTGASVIAANAALTSTRIPFADSNGLLTDDADMVYVVADNELILGAPSAPVASVKDRGLCIVRTGGTVSAEIDVYCYGIAGFNAGLRLTSTRGSYASPGQGLTDDGGFIAFGTYDDAGNAFSNAAIKGLNSQSQTTSARGAYISFETIANGGTTRTERLRLLPDGQLVQAEVATNPGTGNLAADAAIAVYNKADTFVIAYNNGGTMTYIKIPLDGSTTTWTHDTTAP